MRNRRQITFTLSFGAIAVIGALAIAASPVPKRTLSPQSRPGALTFNPFQPTRSPLPVLAPAVGPEGGPGIGPGSYTPDDQPPPARKRRPPATPDYIPNDPRSPMR